MKLPEGITSTAEYDLLGEYRYYLNRRWAPGGQTCTFVMLNPSTATEDQDDPTVAKCRRFSQQWGFNALTVANIFALRSTDPRNLYTHPDPIGLNNDTWILKAAREASLVVVAWGNHGRLLNRNDAVRRILFNSQDRLDVRCFRITKAGQPEHPLYQPFARELIRF
jgi:hypothetical protein